MKINHFVKNKGFTIKISLFITLFAVLTHGYLEAQQSVIAAEKGIQDNYNIIAAKKINGSTVEVSFSNGQKLLLDFYGDHIFRLFQDNTGETMRAPEAKPEASILVADARKGVAELSISEKGDELIVSAGRINIVFDKSSSLFKVINRQTNTVVLQETGLPAFEENRVTISLKENSDEYFYGGGVQNGRFSHKGKSIAIENLSTWTDGGVASPYNTPRKSDHWLS